MSLLDDFQSQYRARCQHLGVAATLPTTRQDDGSPHLEIVNGVYQYVVTERGQEYERKVTRDRDEALYWFVSDVVSGLASRSELSQRVAGQDFRRLYFANEVELMRRLSPAWADRKAEEIAAILARAPYVDSV